jgi:serine/threonine-protein kinase
MSLDSPRFREIDALFREALEVPTEERHRWLEEATEDPELRAGVLRLLEADAAAGDFLTEPLDGEPGAAPPPRLGPYRIVERIGRGGMGEVYLAERADATFERQVAIKVLRGDLLGPEPLERMWRERRTLARLEHPSIARLYDAGTAPDGRPYLVLEYVEGLPIDRYCRENELSLDARLRLFRRVCEAVAFSHHHLLVHRDLKPSNIVVTPEGVPKLLDFGIAKAIDEDGATATLTLAGMRPMTPSFASPEQIRGEPVTVATDVYSLGVLLCLLLTGRPPYRVDGAATPAWLERAICDEPPESPSVLAAESRAGTEPPPFAARSLRGDLDNIVLTALRKEPERRYPSAEALGEDVDRYLADRPVAARGDSWSYRCAKFVRRRRRLLGVAAALVLVVVNAVLATAYVRGSAAEVLCDGAEERWREVWSDGHKAEFSAAFGATGFPFAREAFDKFAAGLDRYGAAWVAMHTGACRETHVLGEQSEQLLDLRMACLEERRSRVAALTAILHEPSVDLVSRASSLVSDLPDLARCADRRSLTVLAPLPPDPKSRAEVDAVQKAVGETIVRANAGIEVAVGDLRRLVDRARETGYPPAEAAAALALGELLAFYVGDADAAEEAFYRALTAAIAGRDLRLTAEAYARLMGLIGFQQQRFEDAERLRALSLGAMEALGPGHPDIAARYFQQLGTFRYAEGRWQETEEAFRAALEQAETAWGEDDPRLAMHHNNMGLFWRPGASEENAIRHLRRSIALTETHHGPWSPKLVQPLTNLGAQLAERGRFEEALEVAGRAYEVHARLDNPDALIPLLLQAQILNALDRPAEAEEVAERAAAMAVARYGDGHSYVAETLNALAGALLRQGRLEEAGERIDEASRSYRAVLSDSHPLHANWLANRATWLRLRGDAAAALPLIERAMRLHETSGQGKDTRTSIGNATEQGQILLALGRRNEARRVLSEVSALDSPTSDALLLGEAELALAEAVAPEDPGRAHSLAVSAAEKLETARSWYTRRLYRRALDRLRDDRSPGRRPATARGAGHG